MYKMEHNIMRNLDLTPAAKLIYTVIAHNVENNKPNISYETIADRTGLSEVTAVKCVKLLVSLKLIEMTKNDRGWNVYKVLN